MRFNARQLKEAKAKAVDNAIVRAKLGREIRQRLWLAAGFLIGYVTAVTLAYHYPDSVQRLGDEVRSGINRVYYRQG